MPLLRTNIIVGRLLAMTYAVNGGLTSIHVANGVDVQKDFVRKGTHDGSDIKYCRKCYSK